MRTFAIFVQKNSDLSKLLVWEKVKPVRTFCKQKGGGEGYFFFDFMRMSFIDGPL